MSIALMCFIAAGVFALGVAAFVIAAIKYRDEDFSIVLVLGALICVGGTGAAFNSAIQEAKNEQRVPVDVQPGK